MEWPGRLKAVRSRIPETISGDISLGPSSLLAKPPPVIVQNLLFDRSVNEFAALNALDMCYLCKIQLRL